MIQSFNNIWNLKIKKTRNPSQFSNSQDYWKARAKKFGKRAVISIAHSNEEFELVKNRDRDILFPILHKYLNGKEKLVLDFGCGIGRFSSDLSRLVNCQVLGVDPTAELIELAPQFDHVKFMVIQNNQIPLSEESVDIVWIYAVLGCIKDDALESTLKQIMSVLKKGGVLFMTENTSEVPNSEFYSYRSAKNYMRAVPGASMSHVHDYYDKGKDFNERFSVMVGHKI